MLSTQLLIYYRTLSQHPLTVVDVETTGCDASLNRVIELSVLQASLTDGVLFQETSLINPQALIPEKISQITGITQDMVDGAPPAAEVLPHYLSRLQNGIFTAHNVDFDYAFLKEEFKRLGISFNRPPSQRFCTVQLSRLMLAQLSSRSLPKLVKYFRFDVGSSHRADADTMACWLLAERLLREIQNEDDETILARFAQEWIPLKIAAKLLNCSQQESQTLLAAAQVESRLSRWGQGRTPMYRRGDVEQLVHERQGGIQLSLI